MANSIHSTRKLRSLGKPQGNRANFSSRSKSNSMAECMEIEQMESPLKNAGKAKAEMPTKEGYDNEEVSEYSGSNSDDSSTELPIPKTKRRRRRRARKRKAFHPEDAYEDTTTSSDVKSVTPTCESKSPSITASSCELGAEISQSPEAECIVEESDSAISQDETYQDLITEHFLLDFEQRMIKEKLFVEHEKLTREVASLESKLSSEQEKSVAIEQSLEELKSDNSLLEEENSDLWNDLKIAEDEVDALKEEVADLKNACDELTQGKEKEVKTSYIELDNLKSQLISKEDELEFFKRKNENEYKELAKNHGLFLATILNEAQDMNTALFTALRICGKPKLEMRKPGNNVLQLLKQLKEDIEFLSERSGALQTTIKQLQAEIVNQNKTVLKITKEKRLLKEEVDETSKVNKSLAKDKAKLEREKENLKVEAARAKNSAQNFKVRLEELKANVRSAKRENEVLQHEKQNIEMVLKNLGVDYKALKDEFRPGNSKLSPSRNAGQGNATTSSLSVPKIAMEKLGQLVVKTGEEHSDLDDSSSTEQTEQIEQRTTGVIQTAERVEEPTLVAGASNEGASRVDDTIARLTEDGFCLRRIVQSISNGYLNLEVFLQEMRCKCGCYEDEEVQIQFLEHFQYLARWVPNRDVLEASIEEKISEIKSKWELDDKMVKGLREEVAGLRRENSFLKSERGKQGRSLEGYRELIRGYSYMMNRAQEGRVVGFREMRCVNRELERYVTLLEKQSEGLGAKPTRVFEGINLIHALYQRLKNFAGMLFKREASIPSSESMEQVSLKSLEQTNKNLRDKLACSERHVSMLKVNLGTKRNDAIDIQLQIHEALYGDEQRAAFEFAEQKTCKKAKGNGYLNCVNGKRENDQGKAEWSFAPLSEKQVAVVIDLVQVKEQLDVSIRGSIELEKRMSRLSKASRDYMDMFEGNDSNSDENNWLSNESSNPEVDLSGETAELLKCMKEKERFENEYSFNEAHIRLLEKQIAVLKSERKACLKALKKYDEEMRDVAPNSMVAATARLLTAYNTSEDRNDDFQEMLLSSNADAETSTTPLHAHGKGAGLPRGTKTAASGYSSNV